MVTTTSEQTSVPWSAAQPYMSYGMQVGQNLLNQHAGFNAPSFQTYVPMSQWTSAGLADISNRAQAGNPLAGSSMYTLQGMLEGGGRNQQYNELYNQASNPYFEQAVQGQADKVAADVQRQFGGLGRIGSAADTGALVDQIGNMRTQAMSQNWANNIANQRGILQDQMAMNQAAMNMAPGVYQQQYLPAERMGQVGAAYDDLAQRQMQSQLDAYNTQQQSGWNQLGAYTGALNGSGGTSSGFGKQTVGKPSNFFGSLLGGALGGGSIGNQIGGATGAGYGALAGGGLSALSSLFNF